MAKSLIHLEQFNWALKRMRMSEIASQKRELQERQLSAEQFDPKSFSLQQSRSCHRISNNMIEGSKQEQGAAGAVQSQLVPINLQWASHVLKYQDLKHLHANSTDYTLNALDTYSYIC